MNNELFQLARLKNIKIRAVLSCVLMFIMSSVMASQNSTENVQQIVDKIPSSVKDVLYIRSFQLDKGYKFNWQKGQPVINSGIIVVLKVDPDFVIPRNALGPILYAGDKVVQRLNHGYESGHVIGIIPGSFDFTTQAVWFGRPGLPREATIEAIKSERTSASYADIKPLSLQSIMSSTRDDIQVINFISLLRGELADLVLQFSPQESDLARQWRALEAKVKPRKQKNLNCSKGC